MTPQTSVLTVDAACSEKWRLVDNYVEATREIIKIQTRRAAALANGREDLVEFDLQLNTALTRKDAALDSYARHIKGHGC